MQSDCLQYYPDAGALPKSFSTQRSDCEILQTDGQTGAVFSASSFYLNGQKGGIKVGWSSSGRTSAQDEIIASVIKC